MICNQPLQWGAWERERSLIWNELQTMESFFSLIIIHVYYEQNNSVQNFLK